MKIQFNSSHIRVFESALYRTTSTVIQTPDLVLVVDPNWLPEEVATIKYHVREILGERPIYLLFTHSDYDHIIGYRAFPDAKIIASQSFMKNSDQEKIVQQIKDWDEGFYIERNYPIEYPKVDIAATEDGQTILIGNTTFTFYLAPGHTGDGLFTIVSWNGQQVWLLGDYLSNIEFPFIYHSSYDYEKTLDKAEAILRNWSGGVAVPGHGDATGDPADIQQRINDSRNYIHQLRETIKNSQDFPTGTLWERYHFREGMERYHKENVLLIKKEEGKC